MTQAKRQSIAEIELAAALESARAQQAAVSDVLRVTTHAGGDLQAVFDVVVTHALALCRGDFSYLYRRDGDVFRIVASRGGSPELLAYEQTHPTPITHRTLIGRVALTKANVHIPDQFEDPDYDWPSNREHGVHTLLGVPAMRDDEVVAVIGVARNERRPFSEEEIRLVQTFADQAAIAIENVRLFNQTKDALDRQTALSEILRAIAGSPSDQQPVLDAIAENAARFCGSADAVVLLARDAELHVAAHHGPIPTLGMRPLALERTAVAGQAVLDGRTVHVADVLGPEGVEFTQARDRVDATGQRAMLAAPLMREGKAIGAILLRKQEPVAFTPEQIQLVEAFADQAVVAIENVRLFNQTKEALDRQTATAEVLKVISRSPFELKAVFETVIESAVRLCGADNGTIMRIAGGRGLSAAHAGLALDVPAEDDYWSTEGLPLDRSSLTGRVLLDRRPVMIADIFSEPDLVIRDITKNKPASHATFGINHSMLGVPLLRSGEVVGVILLRRREVKPFSAADIALAETFADQAVIAIENVRLFNETKEALERQTATREVLEVISRSSADIRPVLDSIATSAARYCRAEDVVVALAEGGHLVLRAHHGDVGTDLEAWPIDGTSLSGRSALERRTLHVPDIQAEAARYPLGAESAARTGHRATLSVPLVRDAQVLGVLLLRRSTATPFTEREIDVSETFAEQAVIAIENVRLFNETKDALERQTAISEILRAIARSPGDEKPVLATIAYRATTFCGAADASILLIRDGKFGFAAHHGPVLLGSGSFSIPMTRESVAGHAVIERRTVQVADVLGPEGNAYPPAKEGFAETGQRAILATPLLREDQPIGAIVLRRTEPGAFSANQVSLVEAFADQAVIAIENVRLFNETKEALERQTSISEVLETIGRSAFDLQPVLDTVVERAARLCDADYGSISTLDGDVYRTKAYWGASTVPEDYIELMRTEARRPGRGTLTGRTALEGGVIHIHDVLADHEYTASDMQRAGGYRTLLGVPLLRDGEVIGVFALCRNDVKPFTDRQIDLVRTFGDQAAIAIENVRLFNETKESLERQTALAEILRVIADSPSDRQPVLDAVARSATRYCGAEDAVIFLVDGNELRRVAHHGPIPIRNETAPLDERGVAPHAVLTRRTIHVADIESPAGDRYPTTRAFAAESGRRGSLAAPLMREGTPIGVILLRKMEPTGFSPSQIQLVEAFADQAMIALENVRLFNETKEALEQQTAVSDVLKTISRSAFDLQPVLDIVLNNAVRLAGADIGWLSRVENDQFMTVAYSSEFPQSVRDELVRQRAQGHVSGPWVPLGVGGGLMGFTLAEGRTVHLKDVKEDPDLKGSVIARLTDARTVVGVPMLREGRSIGGMVLARYDVQPFGTRELELVQTFADQAAIAIENVRLFNETKSGLDRQTAISEVLRAIAASPTEVGPVLDAIAESAARFCGAKDVLVVLAEDGRFLTFAHAGFTDHLSPSERRVNLGLDTQPGRPITGASVTGRAYLERRTLHVPDALLLPEEEYPIAVQDARRYGDRALLSTPLLRQGEPIGAITLRRTEPQAFDTRQIDLVRTFADQAVIAIENVRLFNETKEALERQTAVAQVLGEISQSGFELRPVLETVIEHATNLCSAQQGFIYRREGDVFRLAVAHGITPEFKAFTEANPVNPMGRGTVTGRVVEDRRTVHVADVLSDTEYTYWDAQRLGNFRAILGVPMMRDDEVIGVMLLWRTEPKPFTEQEIALVTTFANQATIAIENVRLFDETKEALDRQTALSDILKVISGSTFDLTPVAETVVERAARLCDADYAWIFLPERGQARATPMALYGDIGPELRNELMNTYVEFSGLSELRRTFQEPDVQAVTGWRIGGRLGVRTAVFVPVGRDRGDTGRIVLGRRVVRPFTEQQIDLVEIFADQAAIAIANARLFNEIQDKSRQLEIASRHKSEFLANMSHELRTPLNAIIGFSEVLIQGLFGDVNEKQREYLQDVIGSGQHLLSLINDILDLSKIEAGRMELEVSTFSLRDALNSGLTIVRERAGRHNIAINAVVADDLGQLEADERKVKQIFYNLLSNAVKFTADGGRVDIIARRENGDARVEVRDSGIGIAEEDQARIFEEFQQVGRERSREGTGLGLTLTKRFVELHGGRIWLQSEPGRGSTFTFTLPLRQRGAVPA